MQSSLAGLLGFARSRLAEILLLPRDIILRKVVTVLADLQF